MKFSLLMTIVVSLFLHHILVITTAEETVFTIRMQEIKLEDILWPPLSWLFTDDAETI